MSDTTPPAWAMKAEDIPSSIDCNGRDVIIAAVHSHAKLRDAANIPFNYRTLSVLSMECCVPQHLGAIKPDVEYHDVGVWSPKNLIRIWRLMPPP